MSNPQPEEEGCTPREQLLKSAPARPGMREQETVERACRAFESAFKSVWPAVDHEKLCADLVSAVHGTRDIWAMARWLEDWGWRVNHDVYQMLADFYRSLETARIEREVEWVLQHGVRFPAGKGQKIAFSRAGGRRTGSVEDVDRARARGFVRVKGTDGKTTELVGVNAESVMLVQTR